MKNAIIVILLLIVLVAGSALGTTAARGFKGPGRAAYRAGWWFGIGFFGAGLYWLTFPFLVDAQKFAWMIPFALAGMSAGINLNASSVTMVWPVSSQARVSKGNAASVASPT